MKVDVLSPSKPMAKVEAKAVSLPGSQGNMQVLPNHASMIAELSHGPLVIEKSTGESLEFFIAGGYVSVIDNEIQVLGDVIETREEIDVERAESALTRAQERLTDYSSQDVDMIRAQEAVNRAQSRLEFAKHAQS